MKKRLSCSGFTLFEILLAVLILGVIALVAISTFSSYGDEQKVTGAAKEMMTALRFARTEAMRSGSNIQVEIKANMETLEVKNTRHPLSKKPYMIDLMASSMLGGVDIVSISGNPGMTIINFGAEGLPDIGVQIPLSYAGHLKTITVDNNTGRVNAQ